MRLVSVLIVVLVLSINVDVVLSASSYNPGLVCTDPSTSFSPDAGNNRSFAEAWSFVRGQWNSEPECSKGPIRFVINSSGTAYKVWYCLSWGQWCGEVGIGVSAITRDISTACTNNSGGTRHYTGQSFTGNISDYSGVAGDANSSCILYSTQECEAVMVQLICCSEGSVAWYVDLNDMTMFYVEYGVNDCEPFPDLWLEGGQYSVPTPSPVSTPSPTPILTPTPTPISTSTPLPSPSTTPASGIVTGSGTMGSGTFNFALSGEIDTGLDKYFESGQSQEDTISEIENAAYDGEVPDVESIVEDDFDFSWLDTLLDLLNLHPIVSVIKGCVLIASAESCSLSCVIFGQTVTFSFCEYDWFFDDVGYFVLAFSVIYSIFIVFVRGS